MDRALERVREYGDVDGDGFVEYRRATDRGLRNQGWKDSFDGINFATGKADITGDSAKVLGEIGNLLARKPDWRLRIEGHTDDVGSPGYNAALSSERAAAVQNYLLAKGVPRNRLGTIGHGEAAPVAPNDTEEGRQRNRRVEIKIVPVTQEDVQAARTGN